MNRNKAYVQKWNFTILLKSYKRPGPAFGCGVVEIMLTHAVFASTFSLVWEKITTPLPLSLSLSPSLPLCSLSLSLTLHCSLCSVQTKKNSQGDAHFLILLLIPSFFLHILFGSWETVAIKEKNHGIVQHPIHFSLSVSSLVYKLQLAWGLFGFCLESVVFFSSFPIGLFNGLFFYLPSSF